MMCDLSFHALVNLWFKLEKETNTYFLYLWIQTHASGENSPSNGMGALR